MEQLKMYWFPDKEVQTQALPEGYSFSGFDPLRDVHAWCECLRGGNLIEGKSDEQAFFDEIVNIKDIIPSEDIHFLDYNGEHVGTATGFVMQPANVGDMHQVGIRSDFRGRGLAKYLCQVVLTDMRKRGVRFVSLTSGEGRPAALKAYLRAGFVPVEYDVGMTERWENVLETFGIDSVPMVSEDGQPLKTLVRAGLR